MHRAHRLLFLASAVLLGIWPLSPFGASEPTPGPAGMSTSPTSDAVASGVEVLRYARPDAPGQSLEIARALVATAGGSLEWAVLASGESWAYAAVAGPLAASLGAPVLLVPPGGLVELPRPRRSGMPRRGLTVQREDRA